MTYELRGNFETHECVDRIGIGENILPGSVILCQLTMIVLEEIFHSLEFYYFEYSTGIMPENFNAFWGNQMFGMKVISSNSIFNIDNWLI